MAMHFKDNCKQQNLIFSISKKILMLFAILILIGLTILQINSYGKYVINKQIEINVKTADYYFTTQPQQEEYITNKRNNSYN